MPASHCEECEHCVLELLTEMKMVCEAGHKPRFYLPRTPDDTEYGWKRVCDDFEPRHG